MCLLLNKKKFSIEKAVGFFPVMGFPRANLVSLFVNCDIYCSTAEFLKYNH